MNARVPREAYIRKVAATTVDRYVAMWNEADPGRRLELARLAWSESGRYLDPLFDATGHAELDATIAALQARFPGHEFRRTSELDGHHTTFRFGWELVAPDGAVVARGLDVAELAADGRLQSVIGYVDELAQAA